MAEAEERGDRVIYERSLRLRRGASVIPFTIRLENARPVREGINDGVEADLIVDGLGSNLDLADDLPFSFAVFHLDMLACILASVFMLRGFLKPLERDIAWIEQEEYGGFGLPMLHDYSAPEYGIDFEGEIEALIEQRRSQRLEEYVLARRAKIEHGPAES